MFSAKDVSELAAGMLDDLGGPTFQQIATTMGHCEVFSKWFQSVEERQPHYVNLGLEAENRRRFKREKAVRRRRLRTRRR